MRTGLLIGILALIICGVVFLAAENNNYNNIHSEVDGLKITTPTGYEKSSESMTELELSNGNNVITVYSQNLEQLKSFNKKYSTLKSKNMDVDGINILFKEYEFSYINPYYYMFNINGKYFVINSQEESNETILSEMLAENNVSSSDKIELPDIEVEKEKPDSNKDSSTSTDSGYSGTEAIFTKNVLDRYDSDGDGRISRSEWNTWCLYEGYDDMSNCDTNGDGYCSVSELNAYSRKYGY